MLLYLVFMTSFIGCLVWKLLSDNRNYIVSEGTMKTILITKRTLSDLSLKRYYEDLEFETIKYERMVVYRSLDKRKWTWWLTLHYNHLTSNAFRTVRFWVQIYLTSSDKCIPEKRIQYKISNCFLLNEITWPVIRFISNQYLLILDISTFSKRTWEQNFIWSRLIDLAFDHMAYWF